VERLLEELAGRLNKLHQLREVPWPEFQADWKLVCATERVLQTAIQAVLDVGAHILAEFEDNQWEEYRDIPERLARHGVIPKELVPPLQGMVGMRNVLVHQYVEVDTKRLYQLVQQRLGDFDLFMQAVLSWLGRAPA
jgi:uncharacterized protein YutE (UPF0331/DUF86 family)